MKTGFIGQVSIFLLVFAYSSISGQKTLPTAVEIKENTTIISYKNEKDFSIPGNWKKYNETVDAMKLYLKDSASNKIGIGKYQLKKLPGFTKGMDIQEFLARYVSLVEEGFRNEHTIKYTFSTVDTKEHTSYKYYFVSTEEIMIEHEQNQDTLWIPAFRTVNLVGVKNEIVYDLSAFTNDENESQMKAFLLELFNSN